MDVSGQHIRNVGKELPFCVPKAPERDANKDTGGYSDRRTGGIRTQASVTNSQTSCMVCVQLLYCCGHYIFNSCCKNIESKRLYKPQAVM